MDFGSAALVRARPPGRPASLSGVRIFLIRHGQTASNAARVVQTPETPLSPRGIAQAEQLARRLTGAGIRRILSSDLARARMTAERLRAATGADLELDALLQERNFGAVRGTAYDQLEGDLFAPDYAPPGGETWEDFHARVDAAWQRVRQLAGGERPLAVVTHGLVCYSLVSRHLRLPSGSASQSSGVPMRFENSSLTVLEGPSPWTARLVNCTAHLDGAAAAELRPAQGEV